MPKVVFEFVFCLFYDILAKKKKEIADKRPKTFTVNTNFTYVK